jgi:hypothetical protein
MTSFRGPRVKVHGVKMVKANFHRVALEASRPVAPARIFAARKDPRIRQAARSNDTRQRPLSLPEAVLICFRLQMQLLHKKSLICTKTLGSIGAMTSASQGSGLEFRFERGVSLGLKSFIARLDEFRTGVAL